MAFSIRQAERKDIPRIAEINVHSWKTSYQGIVPQAILEGMDPIDQERRIHTHFDPPVRGEYWVATTHHVVGYTNFGPNRDRDAQPWVGELYAIYLDPRYHSLGIGSRLMTHAIERLQELEYTEAVLWVLAKNEHAKNFYLRHGWKYDCEGNPIPIGPTLLPQVRYRYTL